MKVKDLILRLQGCDPEAMVVVDGYEGGVTELKVINQRAYLALNMHEEDYYGEHELDGHDYPDAKHVHAIYLPR